MHHPHDAEKPPAGPGTGPPAGDPGNAAGAASAPGAASPAPAALLAIGAAGEVLAAWAPVLPHAPVTPAELVALATAGGCYPADPGWWQVHPRDVVAFGDLSDSPAGHFHDADPDIRCWCLRPGTHAGPRRDTALAAFGAEPAGDIRLVAMQALAAGEFPLDLTPDPGDPGDCEWKVLRGSGQVTPHGSRSAANHAADAYPGPVAIYAFRPGLGEWHRYDHRPGWAEALPPAAGDDPARPWRLAWLSGHRDYPAREAAVIGTAEHPSPLAFYQRDAATGRWQLDELIGGTR